MYVRMYKVLHEYLDIHNHKQSTQHFDSATISNSSVNFCLTNHCIQSTFVSPAAHRVSTSRASAHSRPHPDLLWSPHYCPGSLWSSPCCATLAVAYFWVPAGHSSPPPLSNRRCAADKLQWRARIDRRVARNDAPCKRIARPSR